MNKISLCLALCVCALLGGLAWTLVRISDLEMQIGDLQARLNLPQPSGPSPAETRRVEELERKVSALTTENDGFKAAASASPRVPPAAAPSVPGPEIRAELAALREENAALKTKLSQGEPKPKPVEKPPDDSKKAAMEEAQRQFGRVLEVGKELPEEIAKELDLAPHQVFNINKALAAEDENLRDTLREFIQANYPDDNKPEYATADAPTMIMALMPKIMPDAMKLSTLSVEDQVKLMKGDLDMRDVVGADSAFYRLARTLHEARRVTQSEIARGVTPEIAKRFEDEFLPSGLYVFKGPLHFSFGRIKD